MKKIYFTVFNELVYDQRMKRICSTLAGTGYEIVLVGRRLSDSTPLHQENYTQHRLICRFNRGKMRYIEFNIRLLVFLLFRKADAICAIDLDTIVPCYVISSLKRIPRVYDAHELFSEMKEVVTRPAIRNIWLSVEKKFVPVFRHGYTVSESIAAEFYKRYGVYYEVIRNVPRNDGEVLRLNREKTIIYQGAINEARGFEYLIPAMAFVDAPLYIYGFGNFEKELYRLIEEHHMEHKVFVKPPQSPEVLKILTQQAYIGINLVEPTGLNQYYSLANKFFDYIQSGIPQVTMRYPEYENINNDYEVAVLIDELSVSAVAEAINALLQDKLLYEKLQHNCLVARSTYNWQHEGNKLIAFYKKLLQ
ncbi:MAG TPA: glycosyltransferase [Agriterribacter sp.]|nr:glycosyltransferase [Agriterribacter sp.]